MSDPRLPAPAADDHDDVVLALHTAAALWARGDLHEAVHWVRRAAAAADENAQDLRAVALARAAADLTTELGVPPSARGVAPFTPPPPPAPTMTFAQVSAAGLLDADDTDLTVVDRSPAGRAETAAAQNVGPRAYRVVVEKGADPRSLTVRVVGAGENVPDGSTEAVLLALDWELDVPESPT
jgi:hypothetical protein